MAGRRLGADRDDSAASEQSIAQLVRCAQLSQNAAQTLEWALDTLLAHGGEASEPRACQLLRAARARLDSVRDTPAAPSAADADVRPLAWL
ncbi:MAG: hypothetical protein KY460_01435 [Actinobacteria bacterium]|nr:hypothetical protein [Actinomycetota bacterium]